MALNEENVGRDCYEIDIQYDIIETKNDLLSVAPIVVPLFWMALTLGQKVLITHYIQRTNR